MTTASKTELVISTADRPKIWGKLQKAMNEALQGGKKQAAAFHGVGISLEQLKVMKPDQVILRMADAFKGVGLQAFIAGEDRGRLAERVELVILTPGSNY